jgi:hypothetical protein
MNGESHLEPCSDPAGGPLIKREKSDRSGEHADAGATGIGCMNPSLRLDTR